MDRLLEIILKALFRTGNITIIAASGRKLTFGDGIGRRIVGRFTSKRWQTLVALDPDLRFGEAYMYGGFVMEEGSIADFLDVILKNIGNGAPTAWDGAVRCLREGYRSVFEPNTPYKARRNAVHHYNIDERLYRLFLDSDMQYSCAYFENETDSIDQAQAAKKRHIAAKLLLDRPGLRVLDIGSGWGGLGLELARTARASVVGVSLSDEQVRVARERAAAERLSCDFRVEDYRNLSERFDRIVSVGMFEHVGRRYYKSFFRKCFDLLADDGVMLLHTIARADGPADTNAWVWRYIFPGGYTPALSQLAPIVERSGFILSDLEVLRLHYAETLRAWRERFLAQRDEVLRMFDETFFRMWEFYLAAFEGSFRYGGLVVFQMQLIKRVDALPLTRNYMYDRRLQPMENVRLVSSR